MATLVGQRLFAMALVSSRGEDYSVAPLTDPDRRLSRIRLFRECHAKRLVMIPPDE